ncbi:dymeclin [Anaeramoeba ignava]|uniref:Dymeclin n=1 Tax=Anaeramoeba ignava TaxID=1746090 RepID=A0A9Q0R9F1_ANAIG|nr:dymeclin [Anaeramoeba ignava]
MESFEQLESLLLDFSGTKEIPFDDPFWIQLFNSLTQTKFKKQIQSHNFDIEKYTSLYLQSLNSNLATFTNHLINSLSNLNTLKQNIEVTSKQVVNQLFLFQVFFSSILKDFPRSQIGQLFEIHKDKKKHEKEIIIKNEETQVSFTTKITENILPKLIQKMISYVSIFLPKKENFELHEDIIQMLIIFLSLGYSSQDEYILLLTNSFFQISEDDAFDFISRLIYIFIHFEQFYHLKDTTQKDSNLIIEATSFLFRIPLIAIRYLFNFLEEESELIPPKTFIEEYSFSNLSLLLILVLTNTFPNEILFENNENLNENQPPDEKTNNFNIYRNSIAKFQPISLNDNALEKDPKELDKEISMANLYSSIYRLISAKQTNIFLYLLLRENNFFFDFFLSRTDIDSLIVPILQTLYKPQTLESREIYMYLVLLLILSSDETFCQGIANKKTQALWFSEWEIGEINIASLEICVLLKLAQVHMSSFKDIYLISNCLAIISNLAIIVPELHPYSSKTLALLTEKLESKSIQTFNRIQEEMAHLSKTPTQDNLLENSEIVEIDLDDQHIQDQSNDDSECLEKIEKLQTSMKIYSQFLENIISIINITIHHGIDKNKILIYFLLYYYKKANLLEDASYEKWIPTEHRQALIPLLQDIKRLCYHFYSILLNKDQELEKSQSNSWFNFLIPKEDETFESQKILSLSVDDILQSILEHSGDFHQLNEENMPKFPIFTYLESENSKSFFLQYVWEVLYSQLNFLAPKKTKTVSFLLKRNESSENRSVEKMDESQENDSSSDSDNDTDSESDIQQINGPIKEILITNSIKNEENKEETKNLIKKEDNKDETKNSIKKEDDKDEKEETENLIKNKESDENDSSDKDDKEEKENLIKNKDSDENDSSDENDKEEKENLIKNKENDSSDKDDKDNKDNKDDKEEKENLIKNKENDENDSSDKDDKDEKENLIKNKENDSSDKDEKDDKEETENLIKNKDSDENDSSDKDEKENLIKNKESDENDSSDKEDKEEKENLIKNKESDENDSSDKDDKEETENLIKNKENDENDSSDKDDKDDKDENEKKNENEKEN